MDNIDHKKEDELIEDALTDASENDQDVDEQVCVPTTPPTKKPIGGLTKIILGEIGELAVAFLIIVSIFAFVGRACTVKGSSMENTLKDSDVVWVTSMYSELEREDIVVIHQIGEKYTEPIVKRIVGLPGDTVKIEYFSDHMNVTITTADGTTFTLKDQYAKYDRRPSYPNSETKVEEGNVFVLGDNRANSADSRAKEIGLIDTRKILGKVVFRFSPIFNMGVID